MQRALFLWPETIVVYQKQLFYFLLWTRIWIRFRGTEKFLNWNNFSVELEIICLTQYQLFSTYIMICKMIWICGERTWCVRQITSYLVVKACSGRLFPLQALCYYVVGLEHEVRNHVLTRCIIVCHCAHVAKWLPASPLVVKVKNTYHRLIEYSYSHMSYQFAPLR